MGPQLSTRIPETACLQERIRNKTNNAADRRENLFLQITPANESEKNKKLIQRINESPKAPTIVYVTLQKTAEKVAEVLCLNEINAHPYHAGMKSEERELIQNRFMNGELDYCRYSGNPEQL